MLTDFQNSDSFIMRLGSKFVIRIHYTLNMMLHYLVKYLFTFSTCSGQWPGLFWASL